MCDGWSLRHICIGSFHSHYKTKVRQCCFRLNFRFIASRDVHYLAEFDKLIVWRNGPEDELLTSRRIFQFMETHLHFGRSIFARGDKNIRTRTG